MSIYQRLPGGVMYCCDICHKKDFWGSEWAVYSSLLHEETCAADLIHTCCEACRKAAETKIKRGEMKLPILGGFGTSTHIVKERKGY